MEDNGFVTTKSTLIYPERRATAYNSQDEINFYIPPGLSLLNTKGTTLNFDLKMKGVLKKSVSQSAGVAGLFESITVKSGNGTVIYETLDSYGLKNALYYYYTKIADNHLRELHEGKPETTTIGFDSGNMYCDAKATTEEGAHKKVCVRLPLYCVGCLTPLREKIFPLISSGGLRITIQLATSERALQVIKCPVGSSSSVVGEVGATPPTRDENKTLNQQGGYSQTNGFFQIHATNNNAVVSVSRQIDVNDAEFRDSNRALLFNTLGDGDVGVAHPFLVGQTVKCNVNDATALPGGTTFSSKKIVSIKQNDDGQIQLTLDSNSVTQTGGGYKLFIDASPSVNPNEDYELSDVNMTVSYAVASPAYLNEMMNKMNSEGGINIDIHTSTAYTENISQGSVQNTMYIKAVNNRAKSITSIPIKVNNLNTYLEDSYKPDQQNIKEYQFILYNVLTPNQPVDVSRFEENDDDKSSFSGVGLKEMSHAISASGYPVNNLFAPWRHFFIGRKLAEPGYSYNMNQVNSGDVRLNVKYSDSSVQAGLFYNVVHHIRRLKINAGGQQIIL